MSGECNICGHLHAEAHHDTIDDLRAENARLETSLRSMREALERIALWPKWQESARELSDIARSALEGK